MISILKGYVPITSAAEVIEILDLYLCEQQTTQYEFDYKIVFHLHVDE